MFHEVGATARVLLIAGTRPEGIKLAPLVRMLKADQRFAARLLVTGQHPHMADLALAEFGLLADSSLRDLPTDIDLSARVGILLTAIATEIARQVPQAVVVQGDTISALAGALAATYSAVPVVHLEAGLRTYDMTRPFPEEANRRLISSIATLHLAPTRSARKHLESEGVRSADIAVTGNTAVDALVWALGSANDSVAEAVPDVPLVGRRVVLVTLHRRESWGEPISQALQAIRNLVRRCPDVTVVIPMHPNPVVRDAIRASSSDVPHLVLVDALPYLTFVRTLRASSLVITDSGGVQEEAATLGVPTVVVRGVTERVEALQSDNAVLVDASSAGLLEVALGLLSRSSRVKGFQPIFGDGRASARATERIAGLLGQTNVNIAEFENH